MRGDAVWALIAGADGEVDHLLSDGIQCAWRHHFLHALPGPPQRRRIVRERLPEVIDPIRIASPHDVVIDSADFESRVPILNQTECRHVVIPYNCCNVAANETHSRPFGSVLIRTLPDLDTTG